MIDLAFLDTLLRAPAAAASRCHRDEPADAAAIARSALVAITVAATTFGAVVGSWRGGKQVAFAAIKMPVAVLGTFVLVAPAFWALTAALGRPWSLRPALAIMLAAGARFALLLLAFTPPLWLAIDLGAPYDVVKLLATLAYGLAGLAGLEMLVRGLGEGPGRRLTLGLFAVVFVVVGGQNAWVLRPYLGVPGAGEVTFLVDAREGGLVGQLRESARDLTGRRHVRAR
jgi:hypothetical protein